MKREDVPAVVLDRAITLHRSGKLAQAEAMYVDIISRDPRVWQASYFLGLILAGRNEYSAAADHFEQATCINPQFLEGYFNLGVVLTALNRLDDAVESYRRALTFRTDYLDAYYNCADVLMKLRRFQEALAFYDRLLGFNPAHEGALNNRGNVLKALGRIDEAMASYDRAIQINPNYAEAWTNRGVALETLRRFEEAITCHDCALINNPNYAEAYRNRGCAFAGLERFDAALIDYDRAVIINPGNSEFWSCRGIALRALKRYDEAIIAFDRAHAINPNNPDAHLLVDVAMVVCSWGRTASLAAELTSRISTGMPFTPFVLLGLVDDPTLQLKCAKNFIANRLSSRSVLAVARRRPDRGKIRVAYFSCDFHEHATAYLIAGLIERHDRRRFDVVGVSFGRDDRSAMRRRIVGAFDQFHDVRALSDRAAVEMLSGLDIDIAVDLKGYTQGARPELLSGRIAPIQVNYLGYPGTTGADFIDYVIADAVTLPFDQQPFYSEQIVHLPDCYQVNDDRREIAERTPTRREMGLPEQGFVFCCFNNCYKITAPVFDVWMRLLTAVPGSVLWLLGDTVEAMSNLRREAQARAVDPARLVFAERCGLAEHLARHRLADLFLDTLPVNAHTTASDALWAGLPVLTCQGRAFAGRVAASLLHAIDLPELVTSNLADYEALALRLAGDPAKLAAIRTELARNRLTCRLFDTERFTRHIEAAYITMWDVWQCGDDPRSFQVDVINKP